LKEIKKFQRNSKTKNLQGQFFSDSSPLEKQGNKDIFQKK
jgi:hypothetical protein